MDPGECSRTSQHANTSARHVYRDSLSGICSRVCNPYPPFHSAFDSYIPNPRNIVSTDCKLQFITSFVFLEQRTFNSTPTFLLFSVQLCICASCIFLITKFYLLAIFWNPAVFHFFPSFLDVAPWLMSDVSTQPNGLIRQDRVSNEDLSLFFQYSILETTHWSSWSQMLAFLLRIQNDPVSNLGRTLPCLIFAVLYL